MKKAILIDAIVLGASIIALVAVSGYALLGRSLGQNWSSLDGPEPVWPAVVGFGSMWMIAVSAVVLVALSIAAAVVRSVRVSRARAQRDDGVPIHSESSAPAGFSLWGPVAERAGAEGPVPAGEMALVAMGAEPSDRLVRGDPVEVHRGDRRVDDVTVVEVANPDSKQLVAAHGT